MYKFLFLLVFAGCGVGMEQYDCTKGKPNECRAMQIVWDEGLAHPARPPVVKWHEEPCPYATESQPKTAVVKGHDCYTGLFEPGWIIEVAWRDKFSMSAYTHEHIHAWQATKGIYDPEHKRYEDWAYGDVLDLRLRMEGL